MNRRRLSREQKRVLIAESLRADPILRDRDHARRCGADHKTVGRVRTEEGIPTPDDVIRAYVSENPDLSHRQVSENLGVHRNTVRDALVQNGENPQNVPPSPEPEPEPDAPPSWEPAGHLHPATSPVETTKRPD